MEKLLEQIEDLLTRATEPKFVAEGGKPYLLVPQNQSIEDAERFLTAPVAKRGKLTFTRLNSFAEYVNDHQGDGTRVFYNGTQFKAVLDHHADENPGWKEHVAIYAPKVSPQWQTWLANNKKPFKQSDFAEFLEDNRTDVQSPDAGSLLDMVRELESVKDVTFKGALKKDNTIQRVEYEENTSTRTKGDIELPAEISLRLSIYEGFDPAPFPCRLRVTVYAGALMLQYEIRNLATRLNEINEALVGQVNDAIEIAPLFGDE